MTNTKKFLIGSVLFVIASYLFGWLDNVNTIATIALVLAWSALYEVLKSNEIYNKNLDRIEKSIEEIEKKM
jgi:ABC-type microcin C transport system permease subunit YejE